MLNANDLSKRPVRMVGGLDERVPKSHVDFEKGLYVTLHHQMRHKSHTKVLSK